MAYDPYYDLKEIYKRKQNWTDANNAGDEEGKARAADEAKKYYASLSENGYGELSGEMSRAGLDRAKQLTSYYGMAGKSPVREYYYTLGKSSGLSKEDIDGLLKYNGVTGEITFGGKNIGKPDSVIDGVSYIGDTSVLDDSFNEYMKRAGVTIPGNDLDNPAFDSFMKSAADKNNKSSDAMYTDKDALSEMYKALFDYANKDVSETDEYKSAFKNIMPGYNVAAGQAGYNAAASGAASNGGNIDSFAAANAMRNQAAMTAKGQALAHQAGLDTYNARLKGVSDILGNLGIYLDGVYNKLNTPIQNDADFAQQYFNNGEVTKQNEFNRAQGSKNDQVSNDAVIAGITGKVPASMIYSLPNYAEYFNPDGTLKNPNLDYKALLKNARKRGDKEDEEALLAARAAKMIGNYAENRQYDDGDYAPPGIMDTEARYEYDSGFAENKRRYDSDLAESRYKYDNDLAESKRQYDKNSELEEKAIEADIYKNEQNNQSKATQAAMKAAASKSSTKSTVTGPQAVQAVKRGEITQTVLDAYNAYFGTNYTLDNPPSSSTELTAEDAKPVLTAAQAADAMKNGIITDNVVDAYNYYYGTNYTTDGPSSKEDADKAVPKADETQTDDGGKKIDWSRVAAVASQLGIKNLESYIRSHYREWGYPDAASAINDYNSHKS